MLKSLAGVIAAALLLGSILLLGHPAFAAPALAARSSDEASVHVVVTPKALGRDAKIWEFAVVMNTHVKPLNDDLAQAAVLIDDAGRRMQPAAWQGDAPGGHHRKGVLQFTAPTEMPKAVEVQLSGIGGVTLRTFRWEVE